jgi:hypothetical protein
MAEECTALVLSRIYADPEADLPLPSIAIGTTQTEPVENPTINEEVVIENIENDAVPKSLGAAIFP